jgi:hypothetical protein
MKILNTTKAVLFIGVIFTLPFIALPTSVEADEMTREVNTDRPGMDYKNFWLARPDPGLCQKACADDPNKHTQGGDSGDMKSTQLSAFRPSQGGRSGIVKSESPPPKCGRCEVLRDGRCVPCREAGFSCAPDGICVKYKHSLYVGFRWEKGVDRPGMDYRNFLLDSADPNDCAKACNNDPRCAAFTYVNPGVTGPKAHCFLKSGVPPAKLSDCCMSGIKAPHRVRKRAPAVR